MTTLIKNIALIGICLWFSCSQQPLSGGSGSDVETKTIAITGTVKDASDIPVEDAQVLIRSVAFLSDTQDALLRDLLSARKNTNTTTNGTFHIQKLDTGKYCLEIHANNQAVLTDCHLSINDTPVVDIGTIRVNPTASIAGTFDRSELDETVAVYARIYGLERVKQVNIDGTFLFSKVPAGNHILNFISNNAALGSFTSDTVTVNASQSVTSGVYAFHQSLSRDSMIVRSFLDINGLEDVSVSTVSTIEDGRIEALFLTNMNISVLPTYMNKLRLRRLYLLNNNLTSVPEELGTITSLVRLNLSMNQLSELPSSLGNLTRLTGFHMHDNVLATLPVTLVNLKKLETLRVYNNKLKVENLDQQIIQWLDTYSDQSDWRDRQDPSF